MRPRRADSGETAAFAREPALTLAALSSAITGAGKHRVDQVGTVWNSDIELSAHATSASRARSFVGRTLVEHRLQSLADDAQLVVSELATNALRHARTPFTVTLAAVAHSLLVEVRDGSPCPPVIDAGTPLDTAGRGMAIVAVLTREWGVTAHADGGKTVWAAFDTPQALDDLPVEQDPSSSPTTSPSEPGRPRVAR